MKKELEEEKTIEVEFGVALLGSEIDFMRENYNL